MTGAVVAAYAPRPDGRAALHRAVDEARLRGLRLVVVNASRGDALVDPALASPQEVSEVLEQLAGAGIDAEFRHLPHGGDPADRVVDVAEEVGAELVVIGLRHRSPVGKLLLGSTAQQILLRAACPVLAVPT